MGENAPFLAAVSHGDGAAADPGSACLGEASWMQTSPSEDGMDPMPSSLPRAPAQRPLQKHALPLRSPFKLTSLLRFHGFDQTPCLSAHAAKPAAGPCVFAFFSKGRGLSRKQKNTHTPQRGDSRRRLPSSVGAPGRHRAFYRVFARTTVGVPKGWAPLRRPDPTFLRGQCGV